jgi:TP901 family phage tail tape measure protein
MATIGQLLVSVGVNASGVAAGLREAETNIERFGTRLFFLGSRISAGVTIPLGIAMGAVAKFGLEFDKAMTESTAIMGDMSASLRRQMEDVALSISKTTKFSAKEAAEAYYDLASAGFSAKDSMASLGTVATFAQAGVIDLSKAGEYLATTVQGVGLKMLGVTDNVAGLQKMSDLLVTANNAAVGTTEDFAKALINTKGALRAYNVTAEQGLAALMAFAQGGITGAKAGTQLLMVLRDMQTVSIRHAENWKKQGLAVYETNGAMRDLGAIIRDLENKMADMSVQQRRVLLNLLGFPDRSKQATMALLGFGNEMERFNKLLDHAAGASMDVAAKQMGAMSNQLLSLRHQFEALVIQLGRELVPVVNDYLIPALKKGIEIFGSFVRWFGTLSTEVKAAMVVVVGFGAALGPAIAITGSWMLALRGLSGIFSGLLGTVGLATKAIHSMSAASAQSAIASQAAAAAAAAQAAAVQATFAKSAVSASSPLAAAAQANAAFKTSLQTVAPVAATAATSIAATGTAATTAAGGVTLLSRAVTFMLGPWGLAIGAVTALGIALYQMYTAESKLASQLSSEGRETFEKRTRQLETAVAMYEAMNGQTKRTQAEQMALDASTRMLADASSLSSKAFKEEEERSKSLTNELKNQAVERRKLLTFMREQRLAEVAAAEAELQAIQARIDEVMAGRAKRIEVGPGGLSTLVPFSVEERSQSLIALNNHLEEATRRFNELKRAAGFRGDDIKLGPDPAVRPPATPTPGMPTSPKEKIELLDKFKKELAQLDEALKINFAAGNTGGERLMLMFEEYGSKVEDAARRTKIWGLATSDVFQAYELGFRVIKEDKAMEKIWEDIQKLSQVSDEPLKKLFEEFAKVDEEREKMMQKAMDFEFRLNSQFMTASDARIAQIEKERQKELDAAETKYSANAEMRDRVRAAINAFYDFETKKAKGTADAIVQRMKDAGVQTAKAMDEAAADMKRDFNQMRETGQYTANTLWQAFKKWFDQMNASNPFVQVNSQLSELSSAFSNLSQVAGDSFGGFAKSVGEIISGMSLMGTAANRVVENLVRMDKGFESLKNNAKGAGGEIAASFIGLASGLISGISGMMQATGGASLGKNMLGGALSGAMMGGTVAYGAAMAAGMAKGAAMAGVWGAVAGAIVGIIVAVFRGRETRSIMKRVGHEWGQDISQGLAEGIKAMMRDENLSRTAATLMNMDKIIEEAGGLNELNFDKFIGKLRDVFVELETGGLTAAQATHVLNENFQTFANVIVNSGRVATKEFAEILKLVRETGLEVAAITEFIAAQTERFGGAMATVAGAAGEKYAGLADEIKGAQDALKELDKQRLEAMGGKSEGDLGVEDQQKLADIDKERAELQAKLAELQKKQTEGAAAMRGEMERIGLITMAGFNASMENGVGVIQAFSSIQPAVQALKQAYTDLGLEADNAAIKQLFLIDELMTKQPALVNGVGAMGEAMLALSNIGGLNAETFALMQEQGMAMYDRLQAEAQALGIDQSFAVKAMIPFLEAVLSANEEYGFVIDENTQKLINQAREMGLLKEKELSTNDILMEGFSAIIEALGGEIPQAWRDMAEEAKNSMDDVRGKAEDVFEDFPQPPPIVIDWEWGDRPPWDEDYDPPSRPPNTNNGPDVPEMAEGGVVRRRTLAYIGERGPEAVIPLSSGLDFGDREPIVTNVYLDGRKVSLSNARHMPGVLRVRGINTR